MIKSQVKAVQLMRIQNKIIVLQAKTWQPSRGLYI